MVRVSYQGSFRRKGDIDESEKRSEGQKPQKWREPEKRWKNVNMRERTLRIDHAILYRKKDGKNQFYASTTKTECGVRTIPIKTMQQVMGHSGTKMILKIYDHVTPERAKEQMKKLDSVRTAVV